MTPHKPESGVAQPRQVADLMSDQVWVKDQASTFVYANDAFASSCGVKAEQVVGRTDEDFFPLRYALQFRASDREVLESNCPMVFVKRSAEGTYLTQRTPFRDERLGLVGTVGVTRRVDYVNGLDGLRGDDDEDDPLRWADELWTRVVENVFEELNAKVGN